LWRIKITDLAGIKRKAYTKFVFIGAGGGSLPLLENQCSEELWWFSCEWAMVKMYKS
jgi:L-2-hydroxyglutarate oxidase LhgO